ITQNFLKIDMLEQTPTFKNSINVKDAIKNELKELKNAQVRYDEVLLQLSVDFNNAELLKEQERLTNFLDAHDAWNLDDKIQRVLQKFNLKEYKNTSVNMLSGGEQRRVTLAGLILKKPDILLLDEPTNHLDVYMVEFLEEMLIKEQFTLVFISHDRYFIDKLATRTIEIDNCKIRNFKGGYQDYLSAKEIILQAMSQEHHNLLKLLKAEEAWLNRGVKARLKRNEGRKKRVFELKDKAKTNPTLITKMKLELQREQKNFNQDVSINKQKMLFEMYDICKSLGDKNLIENFSTRILQKDSIAIVGKNGSGKSTFLKILLGDIKIDKGVFKKGDFKIGYFDQQREMLDMDKNLIETFCPNGGDRVDVRGSSMHVYGYMKNFLFPKEDMNKKIGVLSGGEKNRVALALLFTKDVDCLILDEPTNDLDIPTINILEEYIKNFQGAVIFVSHDRYFVDKIAQKLFIFKGNGKIEESWQNYSQYLSLEKEIKEIESFNPKEKIETKKKDKSQNSAKLSYKEKQDYKMLPIEIEKVEDELAKLNKCLENPECYEKIGLKNLSIDLDKKQVYLDQLIEDFLELEEKIEKIKL
ncbi:MAG: ABC-F family ATP-binding cassette domain-containing protein, partial [Campylobacteraceae bacterium]|nr:ABC-F family ATP-binding cassette domain-containing protein [Campylobacteraceae bacterium]